MKHLLFFIASLFIINNANLFAQEKHFVFIQNENNQAFYVKLAGKNYSSTASGYIIIPKLSEGGYTISIGFAKELFPEQSFQFSIANKDVGFSLKNFGDKGWSLFNLQTLATIQGTPTSVAKDSKTEKEKTGSEAPITFGPKKTEPVNVTQPAKNNELGNAGKLNDSINKKTVLEKGTAKRIEVVEQKKEAEKQVAVTDVNVENKENESIVDKKNDLAEVAIPVLNKEEKQKSEKPISKIEKLNEVKNSEGILQTYVDAQYKRPDTIQLVIPASKSNNAEPIIVNSTVVNSGNEETKFLPIVIDPLKGEQPNDNLLKGNKDMVTNNNCEALANEDDYTRVRRKMAQENTDEKMIDVAKKYYRNKCFTTEQLKSLSTLFLSDEGRYKFFEASYEFVYDPQKYAALESEFIDPDFTNRFRTMFKN